MKTISKTKFNLIGHKEDRSNRIFHKIKDLRAEKSYAIALLAVPSWLDLAYLRDFVKVFDLLGVKMVM